MARQLNQVCFSPLEINNGSYQTVATFSQKPKIRALLEPQLLKEVGVLAILFFK
jgi:hypothetical protein